MRYFEGCSMPNMVRLAGPDRVVRAARDIEADSALIFELIADPSQQPRWDGEREPVAGRACQRVHARLVMFIKTLTSGSRSRESRRGVR